MWIFKLIIGVLLVYGLYKIDIFHLGHMTIFTAKYRIDMSLITVAISLIIIFIIIYYGLKLLANLNMLPTKFRQSRQNRRLLHHQKILNWAYIDYLSGKYKSANKRLERLNDSYNLNDEGFFFHVLRYNVALGLQDPELALKHINALDKFNHESYDLAKLILQASALIIAQNYSQALVKLDEVIILDKNNLKAHQLRLSALFKLWENEKAFDELIWLAKQNNTILFNDLTTYARDLFVRLNDEELIKYYYNKLPTNVTLDTKVMEGYNLALDKSRVAKDVL